MTRQVAEYWRSEKIAAAIFVSDRSDAFGIDDLLSSAPQIKASNPPNAPLKS
jgi:hypothetical protein